MRSTERHGPSYASEDLPHPAALREAPSMFAAEMESSPAMKRRHERNHDQIISIALQLFHQIRYGCGNEHACRTPLCLTFQCSRKDGPPHRTPTTLSARAIATCLAMQPNPRARLCPHLPSERGDASSDAGLIDTKSFIQKLFNSPIWQKPLAETTAITSNPLIVARTIIGLELELDPPTCDPTHICIGLDALCDSLPRFNQIGPDGEVSTKIWPAWVQLRRRGRYLLEPPENAQPGSRTLAEGCMALTSSFQNDNALQLLRQILRAFVKCSYQDNEGIQNTNVEFEILGFLAPDTATLQPLLRAHVDKPSWHGDRSNRPASTAHAVLEWCRVMLQQSWDNRPVFSWASMTGCAIDFMSMLYRHRDLLEIDKRLFETPYLFKRMEFMDLPRSWLEDPIPPNHAHLLSYPWLFPVSGLVTYFRVINHMNMSKAFNASVSLQYLINRHKILVDSNDDQIYDRLRTAMGQLLVLEIKRHKILEDAMNGLWRRQRRELRRPLKVRMGMDEGEEGVDFGGVQQEFFRLSLGEALDPDYGLFATDDTTRMTWFLPCSKAPLHHYVLIGILVGLAVYNGITLSVTFPQALYRKLLDEPVEALEHIEDGWSTLTKGLRSLLQYRDGDVGDVFMRTYAFSAETNGTTVSADMLAHARDEPWPGPNGPGSSEEAEANAVLVTNENREQFVQDYIYWLTDKSVRAQYEAFAKGFFLCIDRPALRLFDAPSFRNLVEGSQRIDVDAFERTAAYDNGYQPESETIRNFWQVVRSFTDAEVRKLLEFVTASDRVPAKGIEEVVFIVQRNGSDDDRLPTSQTCFGRLLLPEYSSRAILETKLRQAMVHSLGFYLQ